MDKGFGFWKIKAIIIQEQLRDKRPKNSKNGKKLLVVIFDQTNT